MANENTSIYIRTSFQDWEWYREPNTFHVFLWLLLMANIEDSYFGGYKIKRGSLVTKNEEIARQCGLKIQNVRTALANLQKTGDIKRKRISHNQIITITNYEFFKTRP